MTVDPELYRRAQALRAQAQALCDHARQLCAQARRSRAVVRLVRPALLPTPLRWRSRRPEWPTPGGLLTRDLTAELLARYNWRPLGAPRRLPRPAHAWSPP